jgi:hypothetical protein
VILTENERVAMERAAVLLAPHPTLRGIVVEALVLLIEQPDIGPDTCALLAEIDTEKRAIQ